MSGHRAPSWDHKAALIQHAEQRAEGTWINSVTIEATGNDVNGLVEIWVDGGARTLANFRMTPTAALHFAEQIVGSVEILKQT